MKSDLERLFCMLVLYHYNLKLLHWKTKGRNFDKVHELAEDYATKLQEFIDDVAEIMLMSENNEFPPTLEDVLKKLEKDDKEYVLVNSTSKYFDRDEIFKRENDMFLQLVDAYEDCCQNSRYSGDIVSKFQEHQYYLRKEASYKGRNRLM